MSQKPPLKSLPNPNRAHPDMAALNDLLNTMNNPEIVGIEVPKGPKEDVLAAAAAIRANAQQAALVNVPSAEPIINPEQAWIQTPAPVAPRPSADLLFFTGRTNVGKDHAAKAAGAKIFGFSEPLYAIASYFFGVKVTSSEGKDIPGVREFLQVVGNWGRGTITEKLPLTTGRACFIQMIRDVAIGCTIGQQFPEVNWLTFGSNQSIWLDACIARATAFRDANPGSRVAITNCRFDGEFKRLQAEGWQHWHVMASQKTWATRLAQQNIKSDAPALKDISETLAHNLDQNVIKQVSQQKAGPTLRCIWNDDTSPKPARLHTLASFLQSIKAI